jgi:uncharacterized membrane protein
MLNNYQRLIARRKGTMSELTVVAFEGTHRAAEVLQQLQELNENWTIDLNDAVAVYRNKNGKLRVEQSVEPTTKEGAGMGGLLGAMMGALLAAPLTAGVSVPATAAAIAATGATLGGMTGAVFGAEDAATWKETYGISDDFVKQVGGMVQPNQSALFVLARASNPVALAERFRGYGGKVLRTTLSPEQARKIQDTVKVQQQPAGF